MDLGLGRHAAVRQDLLPGLRAATKHCRPAICCARRPTTRCRSSISCGRGDRSYFDMRTMYFYGFSEADDQTPDPDHPSGDRLQLRLRATRSSAAKSAYAATSPACRATPANFDAITQVAVQQQPVRPDHRGHRLQEHQQLPAARHRRAPTRACRTDATWQTHARSTLRPGVHAVRQRCAATSPR